MNHQIFSVSLARNSMLPTSGSDVMTTGSDRKWPEVVGYIRETPEMTSYRFKTSAYQPEVTSSRPEVIGKWPEVVGDNRETPEMTSYRSKKFPYQPEVTSSRSVETEKLREVVGANRETATTGLLKKDAACAHLH